MSLNTSDQEVNLLNQIYNNPDTTYALDLSKHFNNKQLNKNGLKEFLDGLPASATSERIKLEKLIDDKRANVDADLSTREGQLVWAAGLGFLYQNNPPNTIRTHPIWHILTHNAQLSASLGTAARYIDLSITNRNATMDWGTPGSWYWFSPDDNHINIDLFNTLIAGFAPSPAPGIRGLAHATGIMLHEVGHSQLTIRFSDNMVVLQKREAELLDASKNRKLTQEEYKELARNQQEFQLRMALLNAAEDNCVNQFSADRSRDFPHDFRTSLNIDNVLLQGTGAHLKNVQNNQQKIDPVPIIDPKQQNIVEAQEKLNNLNQILATAFYTTNGLFNKNDVETWKELGIDPDKAVITDKGATTATAANKFLGVQSNFDHLLDQAVGRNGISSQQPAERDRWLLQSIFAKSVGTYADQRCQIIDNIWNNYAAPYAKILIDVAEQNAENQMKQAQQNQKSQQNSQAGQSSSQGSDGSQENQDNPSPSQGSGQQSSQSQSDGQSGQPGQQSGGSQSQSGQSNSADLPSSSNSSGGSSSQDDEPKDGANGNTDTPSSVDVDGVGKMDLDNKPLPATPEEARKAERNGEEENAKPDDAKTVRDLVREARQLERNANPNNSGSGNSNSTAQSGMPNADLNMDAGDKGGRQKGIDLASLSKGKWSEFRKRINELEPVITSISVDFNYIRDKQKHPVRNISKNKEELPRGGDIVGRLDMQSQMNLAVKRATRQQPELQDRQKWKVDNIKAEATTVEVWILGDGSLSMDEKLPGGGRRIDSAVQSMAILYESGRRANFDAFAGVWGDDELRLVAKPGDNDQTVGQNFEKVRNGIQSGTQLSPSLIQATEYSAKQENNADGRQKKFAGMTHFMIITDGELNSSDIEPTVKVINKLFRYGPAVSIDIAILGGTGSEMQQVVDKVKKTNPAAPIDILRANDAKEIPKQLAARIKKRFEKSAEDVLAVPDTIKRDAFTSAHRAMMRP